MRRDPVDLREGLPRMPSWRPWWIAAALWLSLAAVAATALWQSRRDALDSHERELALLSMALTDEIDRGLGGVEEGLRAMRSELLEARPPSLGPDAERALHLRAALMPLVDSVWIVDADGTTRSASDASAAPASIAFVPALAELGDDAMAVSRPYEDARTHEMRVGLAIRAGATADADSGWIVAAVPARLLLGAFSAAMSEADARLYLFRGDGVFIAGTGVAPPGIAAALAAQSLADRSAVSVLRFADGGDRLVGWHAVPRYGIRVVVARDLDAVIAAWRSAALLAGAVLVLLGAIVSVAVARVQRADQRRGEAQEALQLQRARASRLESLGTLAGGVAHDFNNVLAGIVGHGELALDEAEPGTAQARHLERVLGAAQRGKALVERVLSFSRGGARVSIRFELEPVVEEVLALLSASLRPGIVIERSLDAEGAGLCGDPTQAFEAVMNLCTNAIQAMPDGGMLAVSLQRVRVGRDRVLSHSSLRAGRYLALRVADEGTGIAPALMNHLFEPFFTTRVSGSGTGLGLAVVHGVVGELGGSIDVDGGVGRGACFTLYFPDTGDDAQPASRADAVPAGRGQKLLVVDDEPELVGLALEMLESLGYSPEGYIDSHSALEAIRADARSFAAVITDEVMPGLGGTELTLALRRHAADVPVLLVSGYGGALLARRAAQAGVTRVLAKPLKRADLAGALAELVH